MVVNHSVKLSFGFRLARLCLKKCTLKKPFFARRKTDLKRGFVPKKAYAYKAPLWLVFQTARVGSRRAFFPRGNFGAYNSAAQSRYAPSLPQVKYAILKFNVQQKNTGNFHTCTLALYHIYRHKSIEIKTFVCNILSNYLLILIYKRKKEGYNLPFSNSSFLNNLFIYFIPY